jgi:hypothetical protein
VTEEWRRLHNEELNDLYCSPNIVRVIKTRRLRWGEHVARMERREVIQGLGEFEGNRSLRLSWHIREHNIKMGLQDGVWRSVD